MSRLVTKLRSARAAGVELFAEADELDVQPAQLVEQLGNCPTIPRTSRSKVLSGEILPVS